MGDALRDRLSDRGSIPLRSIYGTSRKDSIYAAFREFFLLGITSQIQKALVIEWEKCRTAKKIQKKIRLLRLQSGGSYSASDLLWTGYVVQYQFLYGGSEIWK